jgi:hypothetical protein
VGLVRPTSPLPFVHAKIVRDFYADNVFIGEERQIFTDQLGQLLKPDEIDPRFAKFALRHREYGLPRRPATSARVWREVFEAG